MGFGKKPVDMSSAKNTKVPDKPVAVSLSKPALVLEPSISAVAADKDPAPATSSVSIDTQLKSQGSAVDDHPPTPVSKRVRREPPPTFVMQLYGAIIKDKFKQLFEDTVHDTWPHQGPKGNQLSVLTGTAVVSSKQVVVVVPDGLVEQVVVMLGRVSPLTYIRLEHPIPSPALANFHSYDSFLMTAPPTAARPISKNVILDTTFNGGGCDLSQAAALEGTGKTFTVAGYLTKQVVFYKGTGPANATLLINGDGDAEMTVKIWSDVNKRLASNLLKVGPVSFEVTAKTSTFKGVTEIQYHCNSPHFGTPLGPPLGPIIAARAQAKLSREAMVKITACDMLGYSVPVDADSGAESGQGPVSGVVVKVVGVDGGEDGKAVVRDARVAAAIFGQTVGINVDVFQWLSAEEWHLDMLSAYDFVGTITKGTNDPESGHVVIEGYKPA